MFRFLDIFLSIFGLVVLFPILLLVYFFAYFESGSPIYKQIRVGRFENEFVLYKFRTMKIGTQSVASHLVDPGAITYYGKILRKTKLDEIPQLINVLKGEMSMVGPRPCLPSQLELIDERKKRKIFEFRPGITGLAQISKIDMSQPVLLAETDLKMLINLTIKDYFLFIFLTFMGKGYGDRAKTE